MQQGYQSAAPTGNRTGDRTGGNTAEAASLPPSLRGSRYQPVFPAAIAAIWKHPAPALLEAGWRWLGSLPLLLFAWHLWRLCGDQLTALALPLASATVFKPVEAAETVGTALGAMGRLLLPRLSIGLPLGLLFWLLAAALGRTAVLRLLGRRIRPAASAGKDIRAVPLAARPGTAFLLTALRAGLLAALYALWAWLSTAAGHATVTDPASRNGEPHIVLFAALSVGSALLLFALWSAASWPLQLAQLLALRPGRGFGTALRDAARLPRPLRNELIEVNLVMGIVRLALLVLWLVLSACPLPFSSVETTQFLVVWNIGCAALWLLAADFFHTVRQALVIRLVRTWSTLLDA